MDLRRVLVLCELVHRTNSENEFVASRVREDVILSGASIAEPEDLPMSKVSHLEIDGEGLVAYCTTRPPILLISYSSLTAFAYAWFQYLWGYNRGLDVLPYPLIGLRPVSKVGG